MERIGSESRKTKETDIVVKVNLDGKGTGKIESGVGFFDHMLNSFAKHGGFDLELTCKGDLEVDTHHSIEDVGIALGEAFRKALGDRKGITRYGFASIPMDESLGQCSVDISGRPFLVFDCDFAFDKCGEMDTQLFEEFFRSFAFNAQITMHVLSLYGTNDHHKAEAMFKSLARALRQAAAIDERFKDQVISTKGVL